VVKFRGAGQGVKALIAELVAGEIGRTLGAAGAGDRAHSRGSANGEDGARSGDSGSAAAQRGTQSRARLPGSIAFDPLVDRSIASKTRLPAIVWFDPLVTNVDRTARNTNLLVWHRELYMIDHGAALYFHHDWERVEERSIASEALTR
jgi:hypothetical protein